MKKEKYKNWHFIFNEEFNYDHINYILIENYKIIKILKDDRRSLVKIIELQDKRYVLKIPREKNNRKWQRFINIFRGSDSFRNYKTMEKLKKLGINSTKAVLAGEKRTPFVEDSFIVMEVLEGIKIEKEDYPKIIEELSKIHDKGYLHGDSQIQNFMKINSKIFLIDLRLQKNIYGKIGRMYEFIYLRESCPEIDCLYDKFRNKISFKIAYLWKKWLYLHGNIRKKIKGKI